MPTTLITQVLAAVGGGANWDIQPVLGTAYCIEDYSSDQAQVGGVPDVQISLFDGVLTAAIVKLDPTTAVQKNRQLELYIHNACYARVTNSAVGAAVLGVFGKQVRPDNIRTRVITAPNGGNVDLFADAGEVWRVTELGAETMNASNWPDLTVMLHNAVLLTAMLADGARNLVWARLLNWYISAGIGLRFAPIGAADNDVGLSIIREDVIHYGAAVAVGAAATVAIQPPEGDECVVTAIAGSVWAGVAPAGSPDGQVDLTDGVTPSEVLQPGSVADSIAHNRAYGYLIDNTNYLQFTDTAGGGCNMAYCGFVRRRERTT